MPDKFAPDTRVRKKKPCRNPGRQINTASHASAGLFKLETNELLSFLLACACVWLLIKSPPAGPGLELPSKIGKPCVMTSQFRSRSGRCLGRIDSGCILMSCEIYQLLSGARFDAKLKFYMQTQRADQCRLIRPSIYCCFDERSKTRRPDRAQVPEVRHYEIC